jgi:hypothetical protein
MSSLLERLTANGFEAVSGFQISGTLPLKKEELIKEILAELVQSWAAPKMSNAAKPAMVEPAQLLKLVRRLEVRADAGVITLHFDVRA